MSKISSKSMPSLGVQNSSRAQPKTESPEHDFLFAKFFGGAAGTLSPNNGAFAGSAANGKISDASLDKSDNAEQSNDELLALIAADQSDLENDFSATEPAVFLDKENPEAIALSLVNIATAPTGYADNVNISNANGEPLAKMLFDDRTTVNSLPGNRSLAGLKGLAVSGSDLGAAAVSVSVKTQPLADFIGPMPAHQTEGMAENDLANLRALRAFNLTQRNAEIDAEAIEPLGTFGEKLLTGASLKKTMSLDGNLAMTSKTLLVGENGQKGSEMTRANSSPLTGAENSSTTSTTAANPSSNGQAGGQNSQQNGGHTGTPTGGSLLNNLNALQTLDTAKGNWTEMLLQRVQRGLAGGKDQLDFQLNPRNLGTMRITLVIQNDRTNVQIQTETSAAASMLNDSEARLAQMLEASGLRLGNLNSGQSHGFGGNASDQHAAQQNQAKTKMGINAQSGNDEDASETLVENNTGRSENLINIQA